MKTELSRHWRPLALAGCIALAALFGWANEASARRGGGSSLFIRTPYGIMPKSAVYGQNMSPMALQRQQAAEQKAMKSMQDRFNKMNGITPPKKDTRAKKNK